jgi:hypothetical protein
MLSDWVSFLAYPNLFGIKGFIVIIVVVVPNSLPWKCTHFFYRVTRYMTSGPSEKMVQINY